MDKHLQPALLACWPTCKYQSINEDILHHQINSVSGWTSFSPHGPFHVGISGAPEYSLVGTTVTPTRLVQATGYPFLDWNFSDRLFVSLQSVKCRNGPKLRFIAPLGEEY